MRRLLWAAIVLAIVTGCSDSMSDEDYSQRWRAAVLDYRRLAKNVNDPAADPQGSYDGSVESQSRAARDIAARILAVGQSIRDLKAPPQFKELHDETYLFYRGQADAYNGISMALDTGSTVKVATAVDRLNNFAYEHQLIVSQIIDKQGTKAALFKDSWKSVMTDIKSKP